MTRLGGIPGSLERVTSISRFRRHLPHHGLPRGVRAAAGASSLLLTVALLSACGSSAAGSDAQQASALLSAGLQAAGRGNDTEAASDYHKCLSHEPKNKFCNYNLGVIDQGAGRNQSAEVFYRAALETDPNFVSALYNLALIRQGGLASGRREPLPSGDCRPAGLCDSASQSRLPPAVGGAQHRGQRRASKGDSAGPQVGFANPRRSESESPTPGAVSVTNQVDPPQATTVPAGRETDQPSLFGKYG